MHQPIDDGDSSREVPPRLIANTIFAANRNSHDPDIKEKAPLPRADRRRLAKSIFLYPMN